MINSVLQMGALRPLEVKLYFQGQKALDGVTEQRFKLYLPDEEAVCLVGLGGGGLNIK